MAVGGDLGAAVAEDAGVGWATDAEYALFAVGCKGYRGKEFVE